MSEAPAAGAAPIAAPSNGAPRNNGGQFAPKAGATGVTPQEGAAPTGDGAPPSGPQTVAEWEGYEGEVDVYGEKAKVSVKSKAEALRAHQELLAYRKRVRDIAAFEKQMGDWERMSPTQRAAAIGLNADDLARQKVLKAAREIDMTPEQRELEELREFKKSQAAAETQRQQDSENEQRQQQRAQARQHAVAGLEKGLELSGLPKTHHTMALLAEIQQECVDQRMPVLPPDLLAKEANKRYNDRGVEPLKKLSGKTLLDRVGPEVVRAILLAERERRGLAAGQPRAATVTPPRDMPAAEESKTYDVGEAEARLRKLRNGG